MSAIGGKADIPFCIAHEDQWAVISAAPLPALRVEIAGIHDFSRLFVLRPDTREKDHFGGTGGAVSREDFFQLPVGVTGSVSFINGFSFWQLLDTSLISPNGGMVFFNDFLHNNTVPFLSPTRDLPIAVAELTPPATTPLPAALPMFMGGAGLIDLLARRKKKKSAARAA